jgi:hypothetical protein
MFSSYVLLSLAAIVMFVFLLRVDFRIGVNELLLKQVGSLFCIVDKV